jgi:hypothetical protein
MAPKSPREKEDLESQRLPRMVKNPPKMMLLQGSKSQEGRDLQERTKMPPQLTRNLSRKVTRSLDRKVIKSLDRKVKESQGKRVRRSRMLPSIERREMESNSPRNLPQLRRPPRKMEKSSQLRRREDQRPPRTQRSSTDPRVLLMRRRMERPLPTLMPKRVKLLQLLQRRRKSSQRT